MTHYVLLKFKPGEYDDSILALAEKTFAQLENELDGITRAQVWSNCVERDTNADLMVRLELTGEDMLGVYLRHPLHVEFANQTSDKLAGRMSFDHQ